MATMIDTLQFTRELRASGFDQAQSEALADKFSETQRVAREELVTKDFLEARLNLLRGELKEQMVADKAEVMAAIAALGVKSAENKADLLKAIQASGQNTIARLWTVIIAVVSGLAGAVLSWLGRKVS